MSIDPLGPTETTLDGDQDWPAKASATIVQYVGTVRDKTTGPALVASRYAVYAMAMGLIAMVLAVLVLVLLVRLLVVATSLFPFIELGETWLAYYILGGLFVLIGAILWRKKEP
ncbi:MAG: hypothetical protein AAF547_12680 [Actinomycetota bacterium]